MAMEKQIPTLPVWSFWVGRGRAAGRPRRMHVKVRFTAVMLVLFLERMKTAA